MTTLLANTIYFGLAHARALVLYSGGTWTDRDMSKSWKQQLEHGWLAFSLEPACHRLKTAG